MGMAEDTMRPTCLAEYLGQTELKADLMIRIKAALIGKRSLEHMLLVAPPGAGKTSLAQVIGTELGVETELVSMPITSKTLAKLVRSFDGIVAFDELHCGSPAIQHQLQSLLEFGWVADTAGRKITANQLTVVGMTTTIDVRKILPPLYDRFHLRPVWQEYTEDEMRRIVQLMARKIGVQIRPRDANAFGKACLGVPRRARSLVLAYRDLYEAFGGKAPSVDEVLRLCAVESDGLSFQHVEYLRLLDALGGAKGLTVLASLLRLHPDVVQEIERTLIRRQLIELTEAGRTMTRTGYARVRDIPTEKAAS